MFDNTAIIGASGDTSYKIKRSLRFNDNDSARLSFTPSSDGNLKTWTMSFWMKRANLGTMKIWSPYRGGDGSNESQLYITSADDLAFYDSGGNRGYLVTDRKFRDCSAWYHIVICCGTSQGTASSRLQLFVNGVQETQFSTETYPSQNADLGYNKAQAHYLGAYGYNSGGSGYFDGYLAEIHFIDGTQGDPFYFGKTDSVTGQWIPKEYTGSYGSQGYYLKFADNSDTTAATLGKDSSGNSNNWTPTNFSVTAGAGNDSLTDTPTNNYCTWSTVDMHRDHIETSNANLDPKQTDSGGFAGIRGTTGVASGKWYFEFQCGSGSGHQIGWVNSDFNMLGTADVAITTAGTNGFGAVFDSRGFMYGWKDGDNTFYPTSGSATTYTNNDVIGCAMDLDNYKFYFRKNGTWINSQDPTDGTNAIIPTGNNNDGDGTYVAGDTMLPYFSGWGNGTGETNFGQRPFSNAAPAGYKTLCTDNLPIPTIKKSTNHFDTVLYTGNGSTQSITGLNFSPDMVWIKCRSHSDDNTVTDTVRGNTKVIYPNTTGAEATSSIRITSFDSGGFSLGASGDTNTNNRTFVGWNWRGSDSAAASNTDGGLTSTVSANPTAGFSVVTWTGTGSATTIGHGLGATPAFIWVKNRADTSSHLVRHASQAVNDSLIIESTSAGFGTDYWNTSSETRNSTVFSVSSSNEANGSSDEMVAYVFAEVAGFSKVGKYKGNGNADGPFENIGFRPAWIIIKEDATNNWIIMDSKRGNGINENLGWLYSDVNAAEESGSGRYCDFVSNGFKIRSAGSGTNNNNGDYVYMAFAESPFKYATAR